MSHRQQQPKPVGGFYPQTKVYNDGSHYIAIPHTERPYRPKKKHVEEVISVPLPSGILTAETVDGLNSKSNDEQPQETECEPVIAPVEQPEEKAAELPLKATESPLEEVDEQTGEKPSKPKESPKIERKLTRKQLFNELYAQTVGVKKAERRKKIVAAMLPYFKDEQSAKNFVNANFERKRRNLISRRIRFTRKVNLQDFNYFVTFTYNDALHTENSFKKKLKTALTHLYARKGWKYVGVWERSPKKKRLHFHGLFNIPQGTMPGYLIEVNDYSLSSHRRQITHQNTYFNDRFGRSDFEAIDDRASLGKAIAYIMKYLEKSGEKIVYSKGLPQYFISDIMTDDIICPIGVEDSKLLLFDDFTCWDEGVLIGKVNAATIKQLRTANN